MSADTPAERDLLGVEHEARGLARVLVARETRPPLAVALLGDWGSGKSSFMNLLRNEVEGLRQRAAQQVLQRRDLEASPYCAGVRSIEFNAWHYADDHLWAGLIRHILRGLADDRTVADAEKELVEKQRQEIHEELGKAREQLAKVEQELLEAEEAPVGLRTVFHWLFGASRSFEESKRSFDSARAFATAALRKHRRRFLALLALLVGAAAAGRTAGLQIDDIAESVWGRVAGAIAALGTMVTLLHGWVVISLDAWRNRVTELADELDELTPSSPTREAEMAHRTRMARRGALTVRVEELEAELADTDPDRRLTRFLRQRSESGDYDAYRGLLSLVHDDLTELTDLIAKQVDGWQPPDDGEPGNGRDGEGDAGDASGADTTGTMPLQRVMLYIDDLDRCDPKRVVEVLAAIHLILAMRLFVVVVAVDPRWLLRCLRHHYIELLDADDDDATLGPHAGTPIDYLEKIFQVAYEVPPMLPGLGGLVRELMPLRTKPNDSDRTPSTPHNPPETAPPLPSEDPSTFDELLNEAPLAPHDNPPETAPPLPSEDPSTFDELLNEPKAKTNRDRELLAKVRELSNELRDLSQEVHEIAHDPMRCTTSQLTRLKGKLDGLRQRRGELVDRSVNPAPDSEMGWYESETERFKQGQLIDRLEADLQSLHMRLDTRQAQLLDFAAEEIETVEALGPVLRTPRTVKRLVNVYRVLRTTAPPPLQDRLATDYRNVLILLAVTLGHPLSAPWLFSVIREAQGEEDLLAAMDTALTKDRRKSAEQPQDEDTTHDASLQEGEVPNRESGAPERPPLYGTTSGRDPLDDKLPGPTFQQLLDLRFDLDWIVRSGDEPATSIETYQVWLPHVARFSFRSRGLSPSF